MNKKEQFNQWIEEAVASAGNIKRASPMPFLLTRINARLDKAKVTVWNKAGWLIGRPSIAIPGLAILIFINVMAVVFTRPGPVPTPTEQSAQATGDEFNYEVAIIYDIENIEP